MTPFLDNILEIPQNNSHANIIFINSSVAYNGYEEVQALFDKKGLQTE